MMKHLHIVRILDWGLGFHWAHYYGYRFCLQIGHLLVFIDNVEQGKE